MHKDWDSARGAFHHGMHTPRSTRWAPVTSATSSCTPPQPDPGALRPTAYLPGEDMEQLMKSKGRTLFAVESKRPSRTLTRRHVAGVRARRRQHPRDDAPLRRAHRRGATETTRRTRCGTWTTAPWPLVFIGGPTATSTPSRWLTSSISPASARRGYHSREWRVPQEVQDSENSTERRRCSASRRRWWACTCLRFYDSPPGWGGAVFPIREGVRRAHQAAASPTRIPLMQIGLVRVRLHSARPTDGGDSTGVHARVLLLPARACSPDRRATRIPRWWWRPWRPRMRDTGTTSSACCR